MSLSGRPDLATWKRVPVIEHSPGVTGDFCEFVQFTDGVVRCRLCGRVYDSDAKWEDEA